MKQTTGYMETVVKIDCECPYCEETQVDCQGSNLSEGQVVSYVCETCGKEFKILVEGNGVDEFYNSNLVKSDEEETDYYAILNLEEDGSDYVQIQRYNEEEVIDYANQLNCTEEDDEDYITDFDYACEKLGESNHAVVPIV